MEKGQEDQWKKKIRKASHNSLEVLYFNKIEA
jgi:hypothetical protein